jgi:ferredoxin
MDEWGYPIIKAEPTPYENASVYESARYAVRGCPRQALNIERISEK